MKKWPFKVCKIFPTFFLLSVTQASEISEDEKKVKTGSSSDTSTYLNNPRNSSPRTVLTHPGEEKNQWWKNTSPESDDPLKDHKDINPNYALNYYIQKAAEKKRLKESGDTIQADIIKKVKVQLHRFHLTDFSRLSNVLIDLANDNEGLDEVVILKGTSTKFNRLFKTLKELFVQNKVKTIVYSAARDSIYSSAAQQGAQDLASTPDAVFQSLPNSPNKGRDEWKISKKLAVYKTANPSEFQKETVRSSAKDENDFFINKWNEFYNKYSNLKKPEDLYFGLTDLENYVEIKFEEDPIKKLDELIKMRVNLENDNPAKKIKALSFFHTDINDDNLETLIELISRNESLFEQLVYIDFSTTNLDLKSLEPIANLVKRDHLKFIHLYDTELLEQLILDRDFFNKLAHMLNNDPSLTSKIIWCAIDERTLDFQAKNLPEQYREAMKQAHYEYDLLRNWLHNMQDRTASTEQ